MSARILVVDDVEANIRILAAKLEASYYTVLTATNGAEALEVARRERPDLILLDVMMPVMDGFECCRRLKEDRELAGIPVVMVTALDQSADRVRGLQAGADDFLTKPPNPHALFARVRNLVRFKMTVDELRMRQITFRDLGGDEEPLDPRSATPEGRVMIVERRANRARATAQALTDAMPVLTNTVDSIGAALASAQRETPDAFVVSARLGDEDALRLCVELRSRPATRDAAILCVVESEDYVTAAASLDLGVNDYIMRPVDETELVARMRSQLVQKNYADKLRRNAEIGFRMAVTDGLTGLYNRRYADQHMARHIGEAAEFDAPLSFLLLDLDRFKSINDGHGHAAGDRVLTEFARRLQTSVRGVDLVARFGGEEFLVVMPETAAEPALAAAERIRRATAEKPFLVAPNTLLDVTVSIGVAELDRRRGEAAGDVVKRADAALYASKRDGRDRVTLAEPAGGDAAAAETVAQEAAAQDAAAQEAAAQDAAAAMARSA